MTTTTASENSTARFTREVDELIRARYPLVAVETFEEVRVLGVLQVLATSETHKSKGLWLWSRTRGLIQTAGPGVNGHREAIPGTDDPLGCLEYVRGADRGLFALCDFGECIGDPMSGALVVRMLRELAWSINAKDPRDSEQITRDVTIFLIGARKPDAPALEKELKVIELPLPDRAECRAHVDGYVADLIEAAHPSAKIDVDDTTADRLAQALLGLTEQEADNVLAKATIRCRGLGPGAVRVLLDEKANIVKNIEGVSIEEPEAPDALGGYLGTRQFLEDSALTNTPEALAFGVEESKGGLLIGLPGCGKDHSAKVAAGIMQRPLLKMSMSSIMSAGGGILGQAEGALKRVLAMADVIKPILHISEFEKAMSGLQSSGRTDGGTNARMIGELLDWMQSQRGTFVLATANTVDQLEPEQVRVGRFSDILFYDLPRPTERDEILRVHLRRRGRAHEAETFDLGGVVVATDGYSGSEIEQVVKLAILTAFKDGCRNVMTGDLVNAAKRVHPLSKMHVERIEQIRSWAKTHMAREANSPDEPAEPVAAGRRGRKLDLQ